MSLTRTVTSAAALAALALVCGPALESSGSRSAAQAAAISTPQAPDNADAGVVAAPAPTLWTGLLPIRPSKIAKAAPGSPRDTATIQAAALGPPGAVGALGIPLMVLRAYHQAADQLAVEQPSCKLPWWLLAGIGHTESGHAESGRLSANGTTRGKILGPRLNGGIPGDAIITDTDHGSYDGDTVYDRAVGPMQFIPSTWLHWRADGNADGKTDPSNIFDATLAAGRYLCANDRDLATPAGLRAAVLSYNHSAPYLATVLAWGRAYRDGASAVPDSPLPVVSDVTKVRPPRSSRPPKPTTNPSKLPSPAPSSSSASRPAPSSSSPAGSASSSASPSATASTSGSSSASPSQTPSCPSASPSASDSRSGAGVAADATTQSLTGKSGATSAGSATSKPSGSSSGTAPSTAASGTTSASSTQSAGTQSATAQSFTPASSASSSSSTASSSSCAP